jgi:hypothetical protein
MSRTDVFALKNTGLNLFLFADVGTENNGSVLTVLSVLARLGQDPWAQAAQWVRLPKPEMIDRLADSIAKMPLPPQALRDARQTAARLIQLLPAQTSEPGSGKVALSAPLTLPRWAMPNWTMPHWRMPNWTVVVLIAVMFALSLGGTLLTTSGKTNISVVPPVQISGEQHDR